MADAFNKHGNAVLFKHPMTRQNVRRSNIKFVVLKNKNTGRATKAKKNDCAAGVANEARPHIRPACLPALPSASLCRARLHRTSLSSRPVPRRGRRP